jgi:hypothetical protein
MLTVLLDVPSEDGEHRERLDLIWPARTPLPRIGDTLTRRTFTYRDGDQPGVRYVDGYVTWQHLVLRYEWETRPGQGSAAHPMLSALVLVLSEGDQR